MIRVSECEGEASGAHFVRQALINYELPITNYELGREETEREAID